MKDTIFMTATEKEKVLKRFKTFVSKLTEDKGEMVTDRHGNRMPKLYRFFTKALYEHLHLQCGFIAHYNRWGFFCEYFTDPTGIVRFTEHFTGDGFNYIYDQEYGDINGAMKDVMKEHSKALITMIRFEATISFDAKNKKEATSHLVDVLRDRKLNVHEVKVDWEGCN